MLRELYDQIPAMVWTTDEDFVLTSWRGGGLKGLGLVPDQLVGTDMYAYFGTRDPNYPPIAAHHRALSGESVRYEFGFQGVWAQAHVQPLYGSDGEIRGVIGVALDITELKTAEAERERLIEELRQALADVERLSGLLPICAHCKRIRNEAGGWNDLAEYVTTHSRASFSHGICEDCLRRYERD